MSTITKYRGAAGAVSEGLYGCCVKCGSRLLPVPAGGWRGARTVVVTQQFVFSQQNVNNHNSDNQPQLLDR
jgi:hypothetical protein